MKTKCQDLSKQSCTGHNNWSGLKFRINKSESFQARMGKTEINQRVGRMREVKIKMFKSN